MHCQRQTDHRPLTSQSVSSLKHTKPVSKWAIIPRVWGVKRQSLQCKLIWWLVRALHNIWAPIWNGQHLLCTPARGWWCPHSPSSPSTCHMHHSQRQYSSCQSDKAPTYSNSVEAKPMAQSFQGWGEIVFRHGQERREGEKSWGTEGARKGEEKRGLY